MKILLIMLLSTIVNKEKQKIIDTEQKIKSLKKSISDLS